jgi:hypothetical protein
LQNRVGYAVCVLATLFAIVTFVNNHRDIDPYSHASQETFVSGCERGGGSETSCRCTFDWIKQNVPAADFKAYVILAASPGFADSQTPAWMHQAVASCFRVANGDAST